MKRTKYQSAATGAITFRSSQRPVPETLRGAKIVSDAPDVIERQKMAAITELKNMWAN